MESQAQSATAVLSDAQAGTDASILGMAESQASEFGQERYNLAKAHDERMRELEKIWSNTWQEIGLLAIVVRDNNEWKVLGYSSFNAWLLDACGKSRSVVYAAMGALDELKDIPREQLQEISHQNAHVLKKIPKTIRANPKVIEAARDLTNKAFVRKMKQDHPELHLEEFIKREFRFTETQEIEVDKAIAQCKAEHGIEFDEEALYAICVEYCL